MGCTFEHGDLLGSACSCKELVCVIRRHGFVLIAMHDADGTWRDEGKPFSWCKIQEVLVPPIQILGKTIFSDDPDFLKVLFQKHRIIREDIMEIFRSCHEKEAPEEIFLGSEFCSNGPPCGKSHAMDGLGVDARSAGYFLCNFGEILIPAPHVYAAFREAAAAEVEGHTAVTRFDEILHQIKISSVLGVGIPPRNAMAEYDDGAKPLKRILRGEQPCSDFYLLQG